MKYRDVPTKADQQTFIDAFHEFKDLVAKGLLEPPEEKSEYEAFSFSWMQAKLGWQPNRVRAMLREVRRAFYRSELAKREAREEAARQPESLGAKAVQAQFDALAGRQS